MKQTYTRKQLVLMVALGVIGGIMITLIGGIVALRVNPFGASLNSLELKQANEIISQNFYGEVDQSKIQVGAVSGAVQALGDPHSSYLSPEETTAFRERLESSFEGIGAMIQAVDGKIIISDVLPDSPAQAAQLQPNDQIQAVDGKEVGEQSLDEVIAQVKGQAGTDVVLTIWRDGTVTDVTVTRASISQSSATTSLVVDKNDEYGYIDMRQSFGSETASEFAQVLEELGSVPTLVIDLRDNPGGYLQAVSDILGTLVNREQPYVIVEAKDGSQTPYNSKLTEAAPYEYVILVNENTASAAEIMTAALQQLAGAQVVGLQTYGKGTVQQQFDLVNGGVLKLTVERWLTPDGSSIDGVGVTPDIEIKPEMIYQLPRIILSDVFRVGDTDLKILTAQYMLRELGYDIEERDGYFSETFVPVLEQFQQDVSIPVTGIIDVATANAINQRLSEYLADESHDVQLQKAIELATERAS